MSSGEQDPPLEAWRRQQEAERERLKRGDVPLPPARPPKKPHLRAQSAGYLSSTGHAPSSLSPMRKPPAPEPFPSPPPEIPVRLCHAHFNSWNGGEPPVLPQKGRSVSFDGDVPPPTPPKKGGKVKSGRGREASVQEEMFGYKEETDQDER